MALAATAGLICTACTNATPASGPSTPSTSPTAAPSRTGSPSPAPDLAAAQIHLVQIATLDQPLALTVRPNDRALYVAEKTGLVVAVRDGKIDPNPVLDIQTDVSLGYEQGLLGLAFSPDGRFLYVNFTVTSAYAFSPTSRDSAHEEGDPFLMYLASRRRRRGPALREPQRR